MKFGYMGVGLVVSDVGLRVSLALSGSSGKAFDLMDDMLRLAQLKLWHQSSNFNINGKLLKRKE